MVWCYYLYSLLADDTIESLIKYMFIDYNCNLIEINRLYNKIFLSRVLYG